ncbi:MAG: hypothetical protein ABT01_03545 [Clostridium sp. SCN 57-10]|nr:MAG: hypothetical protein ABT01_03545 [Clostridium sp. SCN 57-10]
MNRGATVKSLLLRFAKLFLGFVLLSAGIAFSFVAELGLSPWDVLNHGASKVMPITMGQASIIIGLVILAYDVFSKERIGFGTFLNILCIGPLFDVIIALRLIPSAETMPGRLLLLAIGLVLVTLGMYFYMSADLGAGPRDTLMVVLTKRLPFPIGVCKLGVEMVAVALGFALGGSVGVGTLISVVAGGPLTQFFFRLFRYDPTKRKNETMSETLQTLRAAFTKQPEGAQAQESGASL